MTLLGNGNGFLQILMDIILPSLFARSSAAFSLKRFSVGFATGIMLAMDIIYVLIPLSIVLLAIAGAVFFWAVRSGQFDDMDSPAHRILYDEDENDLPGSQTPIANSTDPSTSEKK